MDADGLIWLSKVVNLPEESKMALSLFSGSQDVIELESCKDLVVECILRDHEFTLFPFYIFYTKTSLQMVTKMFKDLTPYFIDEANGKLIAYPNNRVTIKGRYYSIRTISSSEDSPFYMIKIKPERLFQTDLGIRIQGRYVYRLVKADCNFEEICLNLSLWQSLVLEIWFTKVSVKVILRFLRILSTFSVC